MYKIDARVGITDVNPDGVMTLSSIIGYFQNCCGFQSADLSLDDEYLKDINALWVLNTWQIHVERFPEINERLEVYTRPYEIKGFMGFRNFYVIDESGKTILKANTMWTLLSLETGRPVRVTKEMIEGYGNRTPIEMDYAPRKIELPDCEEEILDTVAVMPYHLDTNNHVNNGQYVRIAECYLPSDFVVSDFRAEYKAQARLGDTITVVMQRPDPSKCVISLRDDKNTFVILEFLTCWGRG